MKALRKLFSDKYLNIQAKLVFPLALTILLLVLILSPLTNQIITSRVESEADRRLSEIADSVGALIENSEVLARNNATLLSKQIEVTDMFSEENLSSDKLLKIKDELGLQELSLYSANFKAADPAFFYGGPNVTRRLQVSESAVRIREELILQALNEKKAVSNVVIVPQGSQVMGVAPVYQPGSNRLIGVVLTAFYMDLAYIQNISQIINTDVAIVKDNAIVISTIDSATGYENLINSGWLNEETPALNVRYTDDTEYRMFGDTLTVSDVEQGSVIVAQPIDQLFNLNRSIQTILFTITGVFALTALWFWIAAFVTLTRPLVQLTEATTNISKGNFSQQVKPSYVLFKDEITLLSENFNTMTQQLNESYTQLEDRVEQRTQELAEARDEAVGANKSKTEFVSIVSHELKLPMTSIKGYSDLMLAGATGELNENQKSFLTIIRNNVNRMATLVSDLADISRIESGNIRIEPRGVPVWDVVDEVVNITRTQMEQKKQTVSLDIPENLPKAWCDRNRFAQILTNLMSNANKYTPENGTVHVQAMQINSMIQIKVEDNGLGMTPEDQANLFSKFFRSADEKIREAPGTGLGLSITKNLIELQGGKVWFESEYRKGTIFYFTLPIAQNTIPLRD